MISILQIGFGRLGIKTSNLMVKRPSFKAIAVVDTNYSLTWKILNNGNTNLSNAQFSISVISTYGKFSYPWKIQPELRLL